MSQSICNICQYSDSRSSECQILLFTISHSREIRLGKLSLLKTPLDNFLPRRLTKFSKSKLENGLFTNFISIVRVLELCSIAYFVVDPVRPPFLVFRDAFSSANSTFWPRSDEWRRHHRIHWMSHFPIPPWWWSSDLDYLKSIEDITLLLCWQQMLIRNQVINFILRNQRATCLNTSSQTFVHTHAPQCVQTTCRQTWNHFWSNFCCHWYSFWQSSCSQCSSEPLCWISVLAILTSSPLFLFWTLFNLLFCCCDNSRVYCPWPLFNWALFRRIFILKLLATALAIFLIWPGVRITSYWIL